MSLPIGDANQFMTSDQRLLVPKHFIAHFTSKSISPHTKKISTDRIAETKECKQLTEESDAQRHNANVALEKSYTKQ